MVDKAILQLASGDPLPTKYKEHLLQGNWKGYADCHVLPDLVLIFKRDDSEKCIKLARLGNHGQVFG